MTIIRAERPHINYTIIKNETLRNNSLSFRARGIHAYLLSMQGSSSALRARTLEDAGTQSSLSMTSAA
jgi:hypothetical protein